MIVLYPIRGGFVSVDQTDVERVQGYTWRLFDNRRGHRYAQTNVGQKILRMHRLLLGLREGDPRLVDHIDGNGLNNSRANLRIVSRTENNWNKRPKGKNPKGVWPHGNNWCARISHLGKTYYLGSFKTSEEAAKAYQEKALQLRPSFVRTALGANAA